MEYSVNEAVLLRQRACCDIIFLVDYGWSAVSKRGYEHLGGKEAIRG